MGNQVTFETKCYEKDWRYVLTSGALEKAIRYNKFEFAETILYINNVSDPAQVASYAEQLVGKGVLTSYVIVEHYADEALRFFGIQPEDFRGGYYYSIAELVSIYLTRTPYLLHFSGDSMLEKPFSWIDEAVAYMEKEPDVKVANPVWNGRGDEAKSESLSEDESFYKGYGFSDQCYLIRVEDFKDRIYDETHPDSERYPAYGGELFEKRVDAWLRNHRYYRITYKHGSYWHRNIPKLPGDSLC